MPFDPREFLFYSEDFEDARLFQALHRVAEGFYVDIGARDPTVASVTRAFYERGWRGIHVEPVRERAERFRRERPGDLVLQALLAKLASPLPDPPGAISPDGEIPAPTLSLAQLLARCTGREIHFLGIGAKGKEDPSHSGIFGLEKEDDLIGDLIASGIEETFSASG